MSGVVQAGIIKLWNRPSCYFSSNCARCCLVSRHFSINCCVCADNTRSQELLLSFQWPPSSIVLAFWPGATGGLVSKAHSHGAGKESSHAHQPRIPSCYREHTTNLPLHISRGSDLQHSHGDGALWFDILTTAKKYLNLPLSPKVDPSWRFHTEIPDFKFLSPVSLSHPLQGLHGLHIPEWSCSGQSAPAAPCLLPTPANRGDSRGDNPNPTPSHRVLPYSSKILLRAGCPITGCSYKHTTLSDGGSKRALVNILAMKWHGVLNACHFSA